MAHNLGASLRQCRVTNRSLDGTNTSPEGGKLLTMFVSVDHASATF